MAKRTLDDFYLFSRDDCREILTRLHQLYPKEVQATIDEHFQTKGVIKATMFTLEQDTILLQLTEAQNGRLQRYLEEHGTVQLSPCCREECSRECRLYRPLVVERENVFFDEEVNQDELDEITPFGGKFLRRLEDFLGE